MEVKKDLAKRYVEVCTWIWAKTMPNIPHEYIVRGQSLPERDFVDFVKIIREYGVEEYWKRYKNKYLYLDGFKYWTMGNPIDETTIINRQKVFSAYDEIAERYDSLFTDPVYAQEDEEIRVQIDWRGENVLDVGCGTGLLIDILKIDKGKYLGVDPSSNMLAKLKWKYPSHLIMNKPFEELTLDKLEERIRYWQEGHAKDVYRSFARSIITEDFEMSKIINALLRYRHKYKYGTAKENDKPNSI